MEAQIPKIVQTNLNDWEVVQEQIERTKIKRYPYKRILGMTLTKYILNCKAEGLNSTQTIGNILKNEGVLIYLHENLREYEDFIKNIKIGVSARFSEEKSRGR